MKSIKYLPIILLLLASCGLDEDRIDRKYILENGTNRTVIVEFYRGGGFSYASGIVEGKGILAEGMATNDSGSTLSSKAAFHGADSAVITFDNTKRLIHTNMIIRRYDINPTYRNVLLDSAYQIVNEELYRFTLTEEDYDNAEMIDE